MSETSTVPRLYVSETFVNVDKGVRFNETEPYETWTGRLGELYRSLRAEYGRCTGKVYVDRSTDGPQAIGWVFRKRMKYDDARGNGPKDHYLREVWVTVHTAEPTKCAPTFHYADIGARS